MCLKVRHPHAPTIVVAIAAIVMAVGVGHAQAPDSKGKEYIDKVVTALGGDHFLNMQTRMERGRMYGFFRDQLSGYELVKRFVMYRADTKPAEMAIEERDLLGKKQDYSSLFLATRAWDITFRGARPIPDEDWNRYSRTTRNDILYLLRCRLKEPGMQFDYIGTDIYVSRHVEILDITDAADQTLRVYLDHNTLLPLHATFSWFDEKTREHNDQSYNYDKYRDAGTGVMWPFEIERERNGYKTFQMFADEVQIGAAVPSGTFDLPAGVKMLEKAH